MPNYYTPLKHLIVTPVTKTPSILGLESAASAQFPSSGAQYLSHLVLYLHFCAHISRGRNGPVKRSGERSSGLKAKLSRVCDTLCP